MTVFDVWLSTAIATLTVPAAVEARTEKHVLIVRARVPRVRSVLMNPPTVYRPAVEELLGRHDAIFLEDHTVLHDESDIA